MRPSLSNSYVELMTNYVVRTFGVSPDEARNMVRKIARERYKPKTLVHVNTVRYGQTEVVGEDLALFFARHNDHIISPSGSVYKNTDEQIGIVTQLVIDLLNNRSKHKKAMLKAKAEGDKVAESTHYFAQTTIKITANSLPGGMGSPYNMYYDKGNYNSITSAGRALIGQAMYAAETTLGGNFAFFSEEEVVNHIMLHLTNGIDLLTVKNLLQKYQLHGVTPDTLYEYYVGIVHKYKPMEKTDVLRDLVFKLNDMELAFFWYFQNLRHLIWENTNYFYPWFERMFNVLDVEKVEVTPDDLFKLDKDLVQMVAVAYSDVIKCDDPKIQVYDYPKQRPELAIQFTQISHHVQRCMDEINPLIGCFIHTNLSTPRIGLKTFMKRNTVILSDTDSVIFTEKDWVEWFTGDCLKLTTKTLQIASCTIYWLTKAVAHTLKKYSISHGARNEFVFKMEMKNEFFYPSMIIYEIKKTYAGQVKIQEGVILKELQTDIKGVQLRGSDVCKTTNKFVENFLVKQILERSDGKISAQDLIGKVVTFENRIRKSIQEGQTEFYKMLSIKLQRDYAEPTQSNFFYWMAWQEIFAKDYGDIQIPTKTSVAPLLTPTALYFQTLEEINPKLGDRFRDFINKYKKSPAFICINPMLDTVPKELIPLINSTSIIKHNIKPLYLTMKQLGIDTGFEDKDVLISEVYG